MRALAGNRIASNVIANASVAIVNGAIGILTVALLARELGPERYGVWVLIGLVTTYLVLGDVGLIAATGRRLAMQQASEDRSKAARIASTHVAASLALAAIVLCVAAVAGYFFGAIFAVPPAQQHEAFGGLLLTGISTALYILFSIFTCQLWARERLDVIAAIEIPVQVGKLLAILLLIDRDTPLTVLAAITIPANLVSGLAAMIACRRLGLALGLKPSLASRAELRETWHLGLRLFAYQFARTANLLTGATIAGNRLGPAAVTSYSLARVLVTYAAAFVDTAAQAVAARAVRLHSGGEADQQRELFKLGGLYSAGLAAFFLGGFLALGEPFMRLWQGGRHNEAIPLLIVLAIGESLAMSQSVTTAVLLGMNRQADLLKLSLPRSPQPSFSACFSRSGLACSVCASASPQRASWCAASGRSPSAAMPSGCRSCPTRGAPLFPACCAPFRRRSRPGGCPGISASTPGSASLRLAASTPFFSPGRFSARCGSGRDGDGPHLTTSRTPRCVSRVGRRAQPHRAASRVASRRRATQNDRADLAPGCRRTGGAARGRAATLPSSRACRLS